MAFIRGVRYANLCGCHVAHLPPSLTGADQASSMKTLIQCDFDGTITEEDASFVLLDAHAGGDWRRLLRAYQERRISVSELNTRAFAMVNVGRATLLETLRGRVRIRAGFSELIGYCRRKDIRFVIVSNGLDFYIEAILRDLGMSDLEVHSGQALFHPQGMEVQYLGPDGTRLDNGFKEAYIRSFLEEGYTVVYMGNGESDAAPASLAHHVFATGQLLTACRKTNMDCQPLESFVDAVRYIDAISQIQV
jgi:2-hydroxy-3-keto-5-methylthiopentenyl-1-phosphate phosphatase